MQMSDEKRMLGSYEIEQSIFIGDKEVVFGVDKAQELPYMVCYCDYNNPLSAEWPTEAIGTDDYLEAMQVFTERINLQIEQARAENEKFKFDMTPITKADCFPDKRNESIVGKVVVMDVEPLRHEYQHSAYQLILADGGNGANGGRGQAVFGTRLSDGHKSRWERYSVLGEIKPERMPAWAKEALAKMDKPQERAKKPHSREER